MARRGGTSACQNLLAPFRVLAGGEDLEAIHQVDRARLAAIQATATAAGR